MRLACRHADVIVDTAPAPGREPTGTVPKPILAGEPTDNPGRRHDAGCAGCRLNLFDGRVANGTDI